MDVIQNTTNKIKSLEKTIGAISNRLDNIDKVLNLTVNISDLLKSEVTLKELIKQTNESISKIEQKLSKVSLPDDTRYYLNQDEIANFRCTIQQLSAMMSSFEQLYKNLVAFSSSR